MKPTHGCNGYGQRHTIELDAAKLQLPDAQEARAGLDGRSQRHHQRQVRRRNRLHFVLRLFATAGRRLRRRAGQAEGHEGLDPRRPRPAFLAPLRNPPPPHSPASRKARRPRAISWIFSIIGSRRCSTGAGRRASRTCSTHWTRRRICAAATRCWRTRWAPSAVMQAVLASR